MGVFGELGTEGAAPAPAPEPAASTVTTRRTGWMRGGAAAVALGFLLLIVGGLLLAGQQVVQLAAAKGRARVGNPVTFTSKDGNYRVIFTPDPLSSDSDDPPVQQLDCTVEDPDGGVRKLNTASAAVRLNAPGGVTAAEFRAQVGSTTVHCTWGGVVDRGGSYSVARTRKPVQVAALAGLAGGGTLLVFGIFAVGHGYRGRPQDQPAPSRSSGFTGSTD